VRYWEVYGRNRLRRHHDHCAIGNPHVAIAAGPLISRPAASIKLRVSIIRYSSLAKRANDFPDRFSCGFPADERFVRFASLGQALHDTPKFAAPKLSAIIIRRFICGHVFRSLSGTTILPLGCASSFYRFYPLRSEVRIADRPIPPNGAAAIAAAHVIEDFPGWKSGAVLAWSRALGSGLAGAIP
jgi:hypothetical protein